MTDLIACYSSGKGTQLHVQKVIEGRAWNRVYLVTPSSEKESLSIPKTAEKIMIDTSQTIVEMASQIQKALNGKITDLEVALNLVSGEGREHMAVISALLKLGMGIRLVALTKEGVKVL